MVNTESILQAKANLKNSLRTVEGNADETTVNVDSAYLDLKEYLAQGTVNVDQLKRLEAILEGIRDDYSALKSSFNKTESRARKLFGMLKRRANENQTPEIKKKMLAAIKSKETAFKGKMALTEPLLAKVDRSVQKYDDIVGAL